MSSFAVSAKKQDIEDCGWLLWNIRVNIHRQIMIKNFFISSYTTFKWIGSLLNKWCSKTIFLLKSLGIYWKRSGRLENLKARVIHKSYWNILVSPWWVHWCEPKKMSKNKHFENIHPFYLNIFSPPCSLHAYLYLFW